MTQKKNQSTSIFTTAMLPAVKHWESPGNVKLQTKAGPHGGHTHDCAKTQSVDQGSWGMQPELQLWALNSPDTEKRDSRTHCLAPWVYAEGNLKTCQLNFPRQFLFLYICSRHQEAGHKPDAEQ